MSQLLIVDDDPQITSALARGLALHGYQAVTENQAGRALEHLTSGSFSGAIIDVMLGADSGLDLVRAARAAGVTLPILMLSALSDVEHRTQGLMAGADDYVVKPFSFDELVARLRVQEMRVRSERPEAARLAEKGRLLSSAAGQVELTEREFEVLALLVKSGSEPMSRGAIFDTLWAGDAAKPETKSENVVDVYIGYLRKKLAQHDFGFEIKTIRNKGFVIEGLAPLFDKA